MAAGTPRARQLAHRVATTALDLAEVPPKDQEQCVTAGGDCWSPGMLVGPGMSPANPQDSRELRTGEQWLRLTNDSWNRPSPTPPGSALAVPTLLS